MQPDWPKGRGKSPYGRGDRSMAAKLGSLRAGSRRALQEDGGLHGVSREPPARKGPLS